MLKRINSFKKHIKKIGVFTTFSYLFQRIIKGKGKLIRLKINGLKHPLYLRNGYYDTHIFHQIFIKEELNFFLNIEVEYVLDCGANIGLATLYFRRKIPNCKVLAIEPEISNYEILKLNTDKYLGINTLRAAVWNFNTKLHLIDNGEGHASFQTTEEDNSMNSIATIEGITITEIMHIYNLNHIGLLKIDIEGAEFELFLAEIKDWIRKVDCLAIEIHEHLKPGATQLIQNKLKDDFNAFRNAEYQIFYKKNRE